MTAKVRIGLAGLGRMGRIHAANLASRCPTAQLARVFDLAVAADQARRSGRTVRLTPRATDAGVVYEQEQATG